MYKDIINRLGLTEVQAEIFNSLLSDGPDKASSLAKRVKRPRGVAYKGLDELANLGLIEKSEKKPGAAIYSALHPANLDILLNRREEKLNRDRQHFQEGLPQLISAYNMRSDRPGLRFYEGEEGIQKALEDTLTSKETIYTFADLEAVEKNIRAINAAYAKKRMKLGIEKRIIIADTPFNREFISNLGHQSTDFRFLPPEFYNFNSGIQIYDNKVSYQVIEAEKKMAIIIDNPNIYRANRLLFEYIWQQLPPVSVQTDQREG